jgi:hypothetical protein
VAAELQALQQMLEVQYRQYPLTRAVVDLTSNLLVQQSTWGPVPSLVGFTLHRYEVSGMGAVLCYAVLCCTM